MNICHVSASSEALFLCAQVPFSDESFIEDDEPDSQRPRGLGCIIALHRLAVQKKYHPHESTIWQRGADTRRGSFPCGACKPRNPCLDRVCHHEPAEEESEKRFFLPMIEKAMMF